MENSTENLTVKRKIFPANVVKVIDPYKLAINRGSTDGIRIGQRMLVYLLSEEELIDPNTNESLGHLEIFKGTGKVIHVQEKLSTIESDLKKLEQKKAHPLLDPLLFRLEQNTIEVKSFENPQIGDLVKPI